MKILFQLRGSLFVAGIALSVCTGPLFAQPAPQNVFYPGTSQPPAQTQGTARITAAPPAIPVPVPNPTYYNNVVVPVGGSYYPNSNPYGGYMNGKANLVQAGGQFMINNQQAALMQQQVTQSQVDTRNKIIQQRMYENSITPDTEDLRQQLMLTKLRHSRNNPPPADIWSGDALNALYQAILSVQRNGVLANSVALDSDTLKHLNLNQPGKINATIGILRDGGKLDWPLVLQDDSFKKDRDRLDEISPSAVLQASMGKVQGKLLNELTTTVERMQADLLRMVQDAAPDQYMEGKRFLRELGKSYKMLNDPNVANYFGKWAPRGRTVAELVQHMAQNGLEIAPAAPGDEAAYQALYQNFLTYDNAISQLVTRSSPSP